MDAIAEATPTPHLPPAHPTGTAQAPLMKSLFGFPGVSEYFWLYCHLECCLASRTAYVEITAHGRRPLPQRVDSVGPWLEALGFIAWVGALTDAALVYLFRPVDNVHGHTTTAAQSGSPFLTTTLGREIKIPHLSGGLGGKLGLTHATTTLITAVLPAILAALAASHVFFLVRALIRHVVERAAWRASEEYRALSRAPSAKVG
ncbi:hypothetical protein BDV93DRAFT_610705 [Ceratobasidium sp. AG-I]|nr:hypothetical protein BDV93DRAFT_610705 [Ceratobasidium sp. AG-I]